MPPTLDQQIPVVGPETRVELGAEINIELAELYKRSFVRVGSPAGTNNYTGSIPLNRPLDDQNGFIMTVPNANTGPCTFNGVPLVTPEGTALQPGRLVTGMVIAFIYDQLSNTHRIQTPISGGSAPIVRTYLANATWTKPVGLRAAKVTVQAAGGQGGSLGAGANAGGGAGAYAQRSIEASLLPASVSVLVPAANTAGSASFGAFVVCQNGNNASGFSPGGQTILPTGADINIAGAAGGAPVNIVTSPAVRIGGRGGSSPLGQGADGIITTGGANQNGINATAGFGGGGGGGFGSSSIGGSGSGGIIIVEEIY